MSQVGPSRYTDCAASVLPAAFLPAEVRPPDLSGFFWHGSLQDSVQVLHRLRRVGGLARLQLWLQVQGAKQGRVHLRHLRKTEQRQTSRLVS